jgi:hypothetical protein
MQQRGKIVGGRFDVVTLGSPTRANISLDFHFR